MHEGQLTIDVETVRRLLADQHPLWAGFEIERLHTTGTVNAIFRVGTDLAARFPLLPQDPDDARAFLESEVTASRELTAVCPFPSPEPVALGEPGEELPTPWVVSTWLPGRDAGQDDPAGSTDFAHDLGRLLIAFRAADTRGRRFAGSGRGGHLPDHDEWVAHCLERSDGLLDTAPLRALWRRLRLLAPPDLDLMCHGDLTPPNLLVREGRLAGVLDTGGFGAADPALDLVGAWHLLDDAQRAVLRADLDVDDTEWLRGMAWALEQALGLVWYYETTNPDMARWGRRTLDRIEASAEASHLLH